MENIPQKNESRFGQKTKAIHLIKCPRSGKILKGKCKNGKYSLEERINLWTVTKTIHLMRCPKIGWILK